ncbi:MAG: ABC transporter ATP-binding protein, partial [Longimicrobiales bacterium]|nr:ABC transporter ATP-binding protein [Longimicrobiales bacterium]
LRSGLPVSQLYVGKLIIDEVVLIVGESGGDTERLWMLVAVELGLAILSDVLGRAVGLLDGLLGDRFTIDTSVKLIRHAALLDLRHFEDSDFYDRLERARRQTTGRVVLLSEVLGQAQDLVTLASFAVGLVIMAPWLILLVVAALVPAFLGEAHFNALNYSLSYSWTPERRELDYLRYVGASDVTAKEVKIFGLSDFIGERYRTLADDFYEANKDLAIRRAGWGSGLAVVGTLGYYAAYVIVLVRTIQGAFTIGDLTFLAGSFARMRSLLEGVLRRFTTIADRAMHLKDLFDFFELEPTIGGVRETAASSGNGGGDDRATEAVDDRFAESLPVPDPIREGFRFERVGFRYPGTDAWVLRDLDFDLPAGDKLALVGENGAGKTTLVKLLARLYDPTEGRILLDGRDLREYDVASLRRNVGVIFQDFVQYQMTAGENLAVGRIDERENRELLESAAARSLADQVIERLPGGYDQRVGRRFADGLDLSGGEWQKIALGRAYMRDAQLLILDEPTASLDARAEYEVFLRFSELTAGKTAVLISHRFSTVRMADRILVLEDGRALEMGTHEELLEQGGRYAELFHLQAAGYR